MMKVITLEELIKLKANCAVAIGFFDGIHLGHQCVIKNMTHHAKTNCLKSVVITFDKSPKVALGYTQNSGQLTPLTEKLFLLKKMNVDYTLIIKFDTTLKNLTASQFIKTYLETINAKFISIGFDFKFGQGGVGSADFLVNKTAFKIQVANPVLINGTKISTTQIKNSLVKGNLSCVTRMLGRTYAINGKVIYGKQLGRTIGFPTANLLLNEDTLLPSPGVYATATYVDGNKFASMTNIGFNPTVTQDGELTIETHLLNNKQNLYGQNLRIEFYEKIREEMKFDGLDALVEQLERDKKFVEDLSI